MRATVIKLTGIVLAVIVGLALWRWSTPAEQARGLHGGPLFSFQPDQVARLEVRRALGTDVLVRQDAGWRLEGQVADLVDAERMEAVLATLVQADGFPVLPGTEPDERRFGFGDEGALELIFQLRGGGRERLALGDVAPVSDQVYASGAGRRGVFGVGGGLYAAAVRLPDSVRLPSLLPAMRLADLDSLQLGRRGSPAWRCRRGHDGRWWLRPTGGLDELTGLAATYQQRFADRRQELAGVAWLQADRRRLAELVFRLTDTAVSGFVPAAEDTPALLADHGLAPPYRTVTLHESGKPWTVALGEQQDGGVLLARRQGALVVTRAEALAPAEGFLNDFLDLTALGCLLADADSLHVDEPDRPLLWGRRGGEARARFAKGLGPWDAACPPGWAFRFGEAATANHVHDLQVTLDRLLTVDLLQTAATDPLSRDEPRWRLRAWFPDGRRPVLWLGRHQDTQRPVLWDTATGRVAVVDEEILVSLRSLRLVLQPDS